MDQEKNRIVDLSHMHGEGIVCEPNIDRYQVEWLEKAGVDGGLADLEVRRCCPHTGTHMDAPFHALADGITLEQVDPLVLCGPAVVVKLAVPEYWHGITREEVQDWEKDHGEIRPGDAVLLFTGHAGKWERGYEEFIGKGYPYLDPDAARYLAEKKIRLLGTESINVDKTGMESHRILLGNGVIIVENICRLEQIGADRCRIFGTFPAVRGASGTWVRLLALV